MISTRVWRGTLHDEARDISSDFLDVSEMCAKQLITELSKCHALLAPILKIQSIPDDTVY